VLLVNLTIRQSCDHQSYAPASSTATCVVRVERARKLFRSRTRSVRYCSIFPSTWPTMYFRARFPENHIFIIAYEIDEDDVPTWTSSAYDRINSAHLETHSSISSRIVACLDSGMMFLKASASSANSKTSRMASSSVLMFRSRSTCFSNVWWQNGKKK
jgi:hypothetical protein